MKVLYMSNKKYVLQLPLVQAFAVRISPLTLYFTVDSILGNLTQMGVL